MEPNIIKVDPNDLKYDSGIEPVFGAVNLDSYPSLKESFDEDGIVGSIPLVRKDNDSLLCISNRKYVEYAKQTGLKEIYVQLVEADCQKAVQLGIKTNTTMHGDPLKQAKIVAYLFRELSLGKGHRTDITEDNGSEEATIEDDTGTDGYKKPSRRPTVYDKIGAMLGISAKRAMMLKVVLEVNPGYFDRMERERSSLYEAYSKCKEERAGFTPAPPKEKEAVTVIDTTGLPKFDSSDPTYNVNTVYEFVDKQEEGGKKKVVVTPAHIIYTTQQLTCPNCGTDFSIVVPKIQSNEKEAE